MNNVYDNGYKLLGTKKDIENYTKEIIQRMEKVKDDYVIETCKETLEIIKDYDDNTIFMINYDNGMGFTYETWKEQDKVV